VVQFVVDNFSSATRSGGKSRVQSVWVSGQKSMISTAFFVTSDWVWNTWAVGVWVKSTALGSVLVVRVKVWVVGDWVGWGQQKVNVSNNEASFDDASVSSAFVAWVFSVTVSGDISAWEEVVLNVSNCLSIAIFNTVLFGVHFNTFVRVDQVSARSVHIVNNFTVG